MLRTKYWLETRNRFFIGVVFISALCLFFVLAQPWILSRWRMDELADPHIYNPPWLLIARKDYPYFIWHFLYNYLLQFTWAIFTIMLAIGGINQEAEKGNALFTLSLPISRGKLFIQRIVVGFLEASALAVLPALLIPFASSFIGLHYNFAAALSHGILFLIGGIVYYMLGVFINTLAKGEATAFFISIGIVIVLYFLFQPYSEGGEIPFILSLINLPGFIAGTSSGIMPGIPFLIGIGACILASTVFYIISYHITLKKNF
jgi:ABC-type transport system involved in multi-copper enzyme maturation permease subunit